MKYANRAKQEAGFSMTELLVSILIMVPVMVAATRLFSVGTNQQASEQTSIDANQEARAGLEMMTKELAQAGSHRDRSTVTTSAVTGNATTAQSVPVASAAGFAVGDWVDIDPGTSPESVKLTAVSSSSISGIFAENHASGVPVHLFAMPYLKGVVPPAGMGANATQTVTTLRFFGDINGDVNSSPSDPNLYYVEYAYDSANNQITRSITPLNQTTKNPALPLIRNVRAGSVQFTLSSDEIGAITSAGVAMTVRNTWSIASKYQETQLSSRVAIPSTMAASALWHEAYQWGGVNKLPSFPSRIAAWASQ